MKMNKISQRIKRIHLMIWILCKEMQLWIKLLNLALLKVELMVKIQKAAIKISLIIQATSLKCQKLNGNLLMIEFLYWILI